MNRLSHWLAIFVVAFSLKCVAASPDVAAGFETNRNVVYLLATRSQTNITPNPRYGRTNQLDPNRFSPEVIERITKARLSEPKFLTNVATFTNRVFSALIRFNNSAAGSSFGSWSTSFPRTAKSRINLRRRGIASGASLIRSKCCRNSSRFIAHPLPRQAPARSGALASRREHPYPLSTPGQASASNATGAAASGWPVL